LSPGAAPRALGWRVVTVTTLEWRVVFGQGVYKIIDVCKEVLATINNTQRWSAAGQQLLDGLKSAYQASSAA